MHKKRWVYMQKEFFSDDLAAEKVAVTSARRLLLLIMCCFAAQTESHNINEMTLVLWLILQNVQTHEIILRY